MKKFQFNDQLKETLHACAQDVNADASLKTRIDYAVNQSTPQKHKTKWKRFAIVLAATLCVSSIGALALSQVNGLASSPRISIKAATVQDLRTYAGDVSDAIEVPEAMGAFVFQKGEISYTDKLDDDNNRFGTYPSVSASYTDTDDAHRLAYRARLFDEALDATGYVQQYGAQPYDVRKMDGISVTYRADQYLFIPVDDAPTADEQARADANELYLSVGTDTRQEKLYQHVHWTIGDIVYSIATYDETLTMEDLFDAAQAAIA